MGCGGYITEIGGRLTSPGFPRMPYAENLVCEWNIMAPEGTRIAVNVTQIDVEFDDSCGYDVLRVRQLLRGKETVTTLSFLY